MWMEQHQWMCRGTRTCALLNMYYFHKRRCYELTMLF